MSCEFTFKHLEYSYRKALDLGYKICTLREYFSSGTRNEKTLINRVDIDFDIVKAEKVAKMFSKLDIVGTFFVRMHSGAYNPLSIESKEIFDYILQNGNEIGLHHECIDASKYLNMTVNDIMKLDLSLLTKVIGTKIDNVSSHFHNENDNSEIWDYSKLDDFGIKYEAHIEDGIFISDSDWINWKIYKNGGLIYGNHKCVCKHLEDNHEFIYLLIHPVTYK